MLLLQAASRLKREPTRRISVEGIFSSVMPINFVRRLGASICRSGVKAMHLFKIRYPDLSIKHRHVSVWVTRNWLDHDHIAALRITVYFVKANANE
ncbi:hypothetical protein [Paraburkholderia lacunae]|uniref:hypothetical protein n=1 Tax=Paraburkholderia lacunae TaxID=2211104 RepID=UPI0014035F2B|nr:hypothetical protein [Paraburkholderia lacunae]